MKMTSLKLWLFALLLLSKVPFNVNSNEAKAQRPNKIRKDRVENSNGEENAAKVKLAKVLREETTTAPTKSPENLRATKKIIKKPTDAREKLDRLVELKAASVDPGGVNGIGVLPPKKVAKPPFDFTDLNTEKGPTSPTNKPNGETKKNFLQRNKKVGAFGAALLGGALYLDEAHGTALGSTILGEVAGMSPSSATNKPNSKYDLGPAELKALDVKIDKKP